MAEVEDVTSRLPAPADMPVPCCYASLPPRWTLTPLDHKPKINSVFNPHKLILVMMFYYSHRKVTNKTFVPESELYEEPGHVLKGDLWGTLDIWVRKVVECYRQS